MDTVLMIGFVIMFASTAAYYVMSQQFPADKRSFHYITMFVTGIASVAYLIMAFGGGLQKVTLENGSERNFYYVRYLDWTFTTPLLLLDIGLLAGASMSSIAFIVGCDVLMIVGGLAGPVYFGADPMAKWILFTIGMIWFLPILYAMLVEWKAKVAPAAAGTYAIVVNMTALLWCAYPVMWALCEGTGILDDKAEVLCYAILDITAKAVLGFILLSNHAAIDAASKAPALM